MRYVSKLTTGFWWLLRFKIVIEEDSVLNNLTTWQKKQPKRTNLNKQNKYGLTKQSFNVDLKPVQLTNFSSLVLFYFLDNWTKLEDIII